MKNRFLLGSLFALLVVALLGASNIPQGWTWDKTSQWFSVLMKDGGGTKFVAAAPKQYYSCSTTRTTCTYNGVSLTLANGMGGSMTVEYGFFVPYKTSDGTWRLRYNVSVTISGASNNNYVSIGIPGIDFLGTNQAQSGYPYGKLLAGGFQHAATNSGNSLQVSWATSSSDVNSNWLFSGDAAIDAKPTWADAN